MQAETYFRRLSHSWLLVSVFFGFVLLDSISPRLFAQPPRVWAWTGGSNATPGPCNQFSDCGASGVYGIEYRFAAANAPGGREEAVSWTDGSGRLWLFGGYGFDLYNSNQNALNELWVFDPKMGAHGEWAWMGGANLEYLSNGTYGKRNQFAASNMPGGRFGSVGWTGADGKQWVFGGQGFDSHVNYTFLTDLWAFDPSLGAHGEWSWEGGNGAVATYSDSIGNFGTEYQFGDTNNPSGREFAFGWTGEDGRLWLFGGWGYDSAGNQNILNDLWVFDPRRGVGGQWAWMGGSKTVPSPCKLSYCGWSGVYGTEYQFDAANFPGSREKSVTWTDAHGRLWLFGGFGFDSNGNWGDLNDLWVFDPAQGAHGKWAWMSGSRTTVFLGASYGEKGQYSSTNIPGIRESAVRWTGEDGQLWLFGGFGYDSAGEPGYLDDLWVFDPAQGTHGEWAWMGGSQNVPKAELGQPGVYGAEYQFSSANTPGGRQLAVAWTDPNGGFWLFGGTNPSAHKIDNSYSTAFHNDLWRSLKVQEVFFRAPTSSVTYGAKPIALSATASSGLAVTFSVVSGPGKVSGTNGATLTFTGAGTVVVAANQAGNASYAPAPQVTRSIVVNKASLIVAADDKTMKQGTAVPALTYTVSGFVNGDRAATALTGNPALTTTATAKSPVGLYAITVGLGTLKSANYVFTPKNGTLTVTGTVATPVFKPAGGTYTGAQKVTIASSPGATIRYTTDGSAPTATHGTVYSASLNLSKTTTVRAIATLAGCTPSGVATATYTIHY